MKKATTILLLLLLVSSTAIGALSMPNGVSPIHVDVTLNPGESETVTKTVTIPDIPTKLDLLLLEDETGSFQDDIANMQGAGGLADQLWDQLDAQVADFQGGVAGFRDFDQSPWGSPGDWVYRLITDLTSDKPTWTAGINLLSANGGNDYPEAQLAALKSGADGHAWDSNGNGVFDPGIDTPAGSNPTWRPDATKVIVLVTDAEYHVNGDAGGWPGPTYAEAITELNDAGVHVIILTTSGVMASYDSLATDTGGAVKEITSDSTGLVDAILAALPELRTDVWGVPDCDDGIEVTFDPLFHEDVESGASYEFDEKIEVLPGTAPGTYQCTVTFYSNGYPAEGTEIGVQTITVTVPGSEFGRDLKRRALELVSGIETDDYRINFKNKLIISYITKSLDDSYWMDASHLDPRMGWLVFKYEFMACNHMKILMADYPDDTELVETYMEACRLLVEADRLLALTMLEEAEANAPDEGTPERVIFDIYYGKAEMYYDQGKAYMDAGDCCRAILQFEYSWLQTRNLVR